MIATDAHSQELYQQAIAIGENMIRIADAIGEPLAGNYFSIGLDIIRRAAGGEDPVSNDMILAPVTVIAPGQMPDK